MGLQRVGHDWATELNWTELARFRLDTDITSPFEIVIYLPLKLNRVAELPDEYFDTWNIYF